MALHRRVYLIGILVGALTLVVGAVAFFGGVGLDNQASALVRHNKEIQLLSSAQRNVEQSQVQFTQAAALPRNNERRTIFVQASAQQQRGIADWEQFRALARSDATSLPGSAQLNADLAAMPYVAHKSTSATSTTTVNTTPIQVALPAIRVAADFSAVHQSVETWWTAHLAAHQQSTRRGINAVLLSTVLALLAIGCSLGLLARAAKRRDADLAERDRDLERVARSNEFEARLQRALELSATEDGVYGVVEQALDEMVPELSVEMLLADSSRAHFQQLVTTGTEPTHRCSVDSPTQCPAAQRGEVLTFESSKALDACPYLKRQTTACSAVCVPVSVSGLTVGVVHAAGVAGQPPGAERRATLELISRRASDRIGMMRAFSDSETQASTDPLTGLPNRRSLENAVRRLNDSGTPYAVAFGDLDHFKLVNDKFGHGAGDHALRVFAKVLRDQLRPDDLYGRFGGEEFLLVLPRCEEEEAIQVLERIRDKLAVTLDKADCPSFTVSFGLAKSVAGQPFENVVSVADGALLDAKREGRDRIVVASQQDLAELLIDEDALESSFSAGR